MPHGIPTKSRITTIWQVFTPQVCYPYRYCQPCVWFGSVFTRKHPYHTSGCQHTCVQECLMYDGQVQHIRAHSENSHRFYNQVSTCTSTNFLDMDMVSCFPQTKPPSLLTKTNFSHFKSLQSWDICRQVPYNIVMLLLIIMICFPQQTISLGFHQRNTCARSSKHESMDQLCVFQRTWPFCFEMSETNMRLSPLTFTIEYIL